MIVDPLENFLMSLGMGILLSFAMMMIFSPDPSAMALAKDSVAATLVGFTAFFAIAPLTLSVLSRLGAPTDPPKNWQFSAVVALMQAFMLSLSMTLFHGMLMDDLPPRWIPQVLRDWAVAFPIAFVTLQVLQPIVSCLLVGFRRGAPSKEEGTQREDIEEDTKEMEEADGGMSTPDDIEAAN